MFEHEIWKFCCCLVFSSRCESVFNVCLFECKMRKDFHFAWRKSHLVWCASLLVNPTTDAIYKPPKPTLEVTCQAPSQTLGRRKF